MSETKFTPGPWRINGRVVFSRETYDDELDAIYICSMARSSLDEDKANGHLVAAAPELYAAADAARELLINEVVKEPDRTIFWQLVAALRKARGET